MLSCTTSPPRPLRQCSWALCLLLPPLPEGQQMQDNRAAIAHCQLWLALAQGQEAKHEQGRCHKGEAQCQTHRSCCLSCHGVRLWLQLPATLALASQKGVLVSLASSEPVSFVSDPVLQFTSTRMHHLLSQPSRQCSCLCIYPCASKGCMKGCKHSATYNAESACAYCNTRLLLH